MLNSKMLRLTLRKLQDDKINACAEICIKQEKSFVSDKLKSVENDIRHRPSILQKLIR